MAALLRPRGRKEHGDGSAASVRGVGRSMTMTALLRPGARGPQIALGSSRTSSSPDAEYEEALRQARLAGLEWEAHLPELPEAAAGPIRELSSPKRRPRDLVRMLSSPTSSAGGKGGRSEPGSRYRLRAASSLGRQNHQ